MKYPTRGADVPASMRTGRVLQIARFAVHRNLAQEKSNLFAKAHVVFPEVIVIKNLMALSEAEIEALMADLTVQHVGLTRVLSETQDTESKAEIANLISNVDMQIVMLEQLKHLVKALAAISSACPTV